jgi:hypothetical protein
MKKISSFLFFLLFTFVQINLFAAEPPEGISLTKNSNGYFVQFTLPTYNLVTIKGGNEDFYRIIVDKYGITPEDGLPELPLVSFNLFIADDESQTSFDILNTKRKEIELDKHIFPKQIPWEKSKPISERPFYINRQYYQTEGIQIPFVKISEPFIIGGVKGVMVTIYPFSYNPIEKKLTIITEGRFEILLSRIPATEETKSKSFNNFLNGVFVNYDGIPSDAMMRYLIITDPQFEAGLAAFKTHKENFGCVVDLFTTAATGTSTTAIKNFIQTRYNDPGIRPEYILLVGDVQHIPAWVGSGTGSPYTDLKYVQLEGTDPFADAFIGRFSVTNAAELQNAINKTIYTEINISTIPKKNVFCASTDNYQISEGTHNYVINNWFDPQGFTNLKLYTVTYNATTAQLIAALNDNQRFAIFSGHGGEYSWADGPSLSQSQVRALTNSIYPFVYSFSCVTGSYHLSECFGETWLRTTNGGSTFYGSSVNSYWDEDDVLEKKLIYAMFEDELTRVTPMFDMAKIYLANHYGSITGMVLRYIEMYNLMGDPSMPTMRQIPPDTTPPDPIVDLTTVDATSNSITLNWTAPYDSTYGGVTAYDIRYSTTMINNDNDFNNAPQFMFTGQSDSAGTPKSYEVTGLDFNTTYYFAAKALDMWGNKSVMSNVPTGITLVAPVVSFSSDSMHCYVTVDTLYIDSLVLSNVSLQNSTLDYSIELTNNTFPDNVKFRLVGVNNNTETLINEKGNETNIYGYSFKGSGGPDLFGYEWIDSNEPDGPQYIWNDITTSGTLVTNWIATGTFEPKDEGYAGPFPIGFDFKFYGNVKNQVYVSSNGLLLFNTISQNIFSNVQIPNTALPNEYIAPFWDDLDGRTQGTVHYKQDGNKFIIQFTNWQRFSATGSLTFQIVLQSNGKIYFYYNNMNATLNSATIGIENADGTDGLQVAYNANYVQNNLAVQISAEPEWLNIDHFTGRIYAGNSVAVIMTIETEGLEMGDYSMDMEITTNDPQNSFVVVPISMTVGIIPVELASFSADVNDDNVLLKWSTATELNNRGFEVERSKVSQRDGKPKSQKSNEQSWNKVVFIEGKGTTTETVQYSYVDRPETAGKYTYRLKQIDFDGTVSYSNTIEVDISGPKEFALYQNYPNPFNPSTTIKFALPVRTNLTINVYNTLGEKISEIFKGEMESGYNEVQFNASGLSSGIYFYKIESESFNSTKKMILMK